MIEYPSIANTKRVPFGMEVIVFDKIDGSNFRAKWTKKNGFCLFGTRTQLVDETTPYWNNIVSMFNETISEPLHKYLSSKKLDNVVVFSEYYGENSFAGRHVDDEPHRLITFDLYDIKKKSFLHPESFISDIAPIVETPKVLDRVKMSYELILKVRHGEYNVKEGVICKGIERKGNFSGGIPMYKIKTMEYLDKLKERFKDEWEKYAE
jgi:hypothetical protein